MSQDFQTDEELRSYMSCAFDLDSDLLESMGREELTSLLTSMTESMIIPPAANYAQQDYSESGSVASDYIMPPSPPADDDNVNAAAQPMETVALSASDGEECVINSFIDVTGADRESARNFLEPLGYDLDTAISLYLENEQPANRGVSSGSQQTTTHRTTYSSGSLHTGEAFSTHTRFGQDVNMDSLAGGEDAEEAHRQEFLARMRAPRLTALNDAGVAGGSAPDDLNMQGMGDMAAQLRQFIASRSGSGMPGFGGGGYDDDDDDDNAAQGPMYDEDGIRRPDPVRQQRLVGLSRQESDDVLARADDPSVDWMFPPPRHMSYMGTLEQARAIANSENRWLLVNIQSHTEFAAQLLNRDVWTNETIEELCRTRFLFWQRGHTCRDGRDYMTMYKVSEDDLPHIAFIDPRTGAKALTLTGLMEASDLAIRMIEFAESRPLNTPQRSAADSPATTMLTPPGALTAVDAPATAAQTSSSALSGGIAAASGAKSAPAAPAVTEDVAVDYGVVPEAPSDSDPDAIKVSIKLSSGKGIVRKYRATDPVRALFAVVAAEMRTSGDSTGRFDLMTRFPTLSLATCLDSSLAECSLAGVNVFVKLL